MPITSTYFFDAFNELIQIPIAEHVEKYNKVPFEFVTRLNNLHDEIIVEARHNFEKYNSDSIKAAQFFRDLITKLTNREKIYFFKDDGRMSYHTFAKTEIYHLSEIGNLEEIFAFYIHRTIQEVKTHFKSYPPGQFMESNKKTKFPSFTVKNPAVLNDAYSQLVKFAYIQLETPQKNFVDIFTGRLVRNRVVWISENNALAYLIRGLIENKAIYPVGKDHWAITKKCFTIRDLDDFDTDILRNSDPPEDPKTLDMIIYTFSNPEE